MPVTTDRPTLRASWPLHGRQWLTLLAVYVSFTLVWVGVGWLLVHPLAGSSIVHTDHSVSRWFVTRRTPTWNSLSFDGSMIADTLVKVSVTLVVAVAMLIAWRRWLEPLMVMIPLALEALCFITVTTIVGRPRPDVVRLDSSPVGSSFPSGHMAAGAAYAAIAVVIFWHTRRWWVRGLASVIVAVIVAGVALSRLYRGMHFLTDVVMGGLLGAMCVLTTALLLRGAKDQALDPDRPAPDRETGGQLVEANAP